MIAREPDWQRPACARWSLPSALVADVSLVTKVGQKLFPPLEAGRIADVVERDLPHRPEISMNRWRGSFAAGDRLVERIAHTRANGSDAIQSLFNSISIGPAGPAAP
jgi:hypothetical protein